MNNTKADDVLFPQLIEPTGAKLNGQPIDFSNKHTPGPYKIRIDHDKKFNSYTGDPDPWKYIYIDDANGKCVGSVAGVRPGDHNMADAALFASAPELFEAALMAFNMLDALGERGKAWAACKVAIAKATGGA